MAAWPEAAFSHEGRVHVPPVPWRGGEGCQHGPSAETLVLVLGVQCCHCLGFIDKDGSGAQAGLPSCKGGFLHYVFEPSCCPCVLGVWRLLWSRALSLVLFHVLGVPTCPHAVRSAACCCSAVIPSRAPLARLLPVVFRLRVLSCWWEEGVLCARSRQSPSCLLSSQASCQGPALLVEALFSELCLLTVTHSSRDLAARFWGRALLSVAPPGAAGSRWAQLVRGWI